MSHDVSVGLQQALKCLDILSIYDLRAERVRGQRQGISQALTSSIDLNGRTLASSSTFTWYLSVADRILAAMTPR